MCITFISTKYKLDITFCKTSQIRNTLHVHKIIIDAISDYIINVVSSNPAQARRTRYNIM